MSVLEILKYPNSSLRKIAKPVIKIDKVVRKTVYNMFDTMYFNNGIGLAATQVNIHKCIIVIDVSNNKTDPIVLINPKILKKSGSLGIYESCLSIPNKQEFILRAKNIKVKAINLDNNIFELHANGILSICIQHELDHLFGKLFIDYIK